MQTVILRSKTTMGFATNQPAPSSSARAAFIGLVNEAAANLVTWKDSRGYALDHGVDEKALEHYVSGACSLYERKEIERIVACNQWAHDHVISLVKSRR